MKPRGEGGPPGTGHGLIPSPYDPADYQLASVMTDEQLAMTPPSLLTVYNPPPVTNQGDTPQCVAYSAGELKAWMDRRDQGKWFDFNEGLFFYSIGGTASGAVLRYAFNKMLADGYPVYPTGDAVHHRIKAYYAVPLDHLSLKQALMAFGPIILGIHWPDSWSRPVNGVVPPPSGVTNGHAILCIGWKDGVGFRFRNSWGINWGAGGDCYIPAGYLSTPGGLQIRAFEAWKALDVIEAQSTTVRYATVAAGSRIRAGVSATAPLVATLAAATKLVYHSTVAGGAYLWLNPKTGTWVTRNDWALVVYQGIERAVVRVNCYIP